MTKLEEMWEALTAYQQQADQGEDMTKLEEMWEAAAAYQQQADDAGHGATWLAMCEERTADAAYEAYEAAEAAYAYEAADAAYAYAYAVERWAIGANSD
jgi:hypothetical protein